MEAGDAITYHGHTLILVEPVEDGRAWRLVDPEHPDVDVILPVTEVQC